MTENRYITESYPKQTTGLRLGTSRAVKVTDTELKISVICESERSQLKNQTKCMEVFNSYDENTALKEQLETARKTIETKQQNYEIQFKRASELQEQLAEAWKEIKTYKHTLDRIGAETMPAYGNRYDYSSKIAAIIYTHNEFLQSLKEKEIQE